MVDGQGRTVALVAAQLPQRWLAAIASRVRERLNGVDRARALVLDSSQHVLVDNRAMPPGTLPRAGSDTSEAISEPVPWTASQVAIQRLNDGKRHVVVRAPSDNSSTLHRLSLQLM